MFSREEPDSPKFHRDRAHLRATGVPAHGEYISKNTERKFNESGGNMFQNGKNQIKIIKSSVQMEVAVQLHATAQTGSFYLTY